MNRSNRFLVNSVNRRRRYICKFTTKDADESHRIENRTKCAYPVSGVNKIE